MARMLRRTIPFARVGQNCRRSLDCRDWIRLLTDCQGVWSFCAFRAFHHLLCRRSTNPRQRQIMENTKGSGTVASLLPPSQRVGNRPRPEIRAELPKVRDRFFLRRSLQSRTSIRPVLLPHPRPRSLRFNPAHLRRANPIPLARPNPGRSYRANPI
jgi:hypothetical protein